jgi:hypothetical protein
MDNVDEIIERTKQEFDSMSEAQKKAVIKNEDSFVDWLRNKMYSISKTIGYIIATPIRAIVELFKNRFKFLIETSSGAQCFVSYNPNGNADKTSL